MRVGVTRLESHVCRYVMPPHTVRPQAFARRTAHIMLLAVHMCCTCAVRRAASWGWSSLMHLHPHLVGSSRKPCVPARTMHPTLHASCATTLHAQWLPAPHTYTCGTFREGRCGTRQGIGAASVAKKGCHLRGSELQHSLLPSNHPACSRACMHCRL